MDTLLAGLYRLSRYQLDNLRRRLRWLPALCLYFSMKLLLGASNSLVPKTTVHSGFNMAAYALHG